MIIKSIRTEQWPVVKGVVKSAVMQSGIDDKGNVTFSPDISYTYQVGSETYTGDKVAIGQMSSSQGHAQKILDRYPVGQTVTVHYAPDDYSVAVLETGIHGGTWICLGVGAIFTTVGSMFLLLIRMAAKAKNRGGRHSSA